MKARIKYFLAWAVSIPTGLICREYRHSMPYVLDEYLGDVIWAMMLYYGARMIFVRKSVWFAFLLSLGFSYTVEFSGLIKWQWLSAIRHTFLGHMVLGTDFTPSDFVCYTIGIGIAIASDLAHLEFKKHLDLKQTLLK